MGPEKVPSSKVLHLLSPGNLLLLLEHLNENSNCEVFQQWTSSPHCFQTKSLGPWMSPKATPLVNLETPLWPELAAFRLVTSGCLFHYETMLLARQTFLTPSQIYLPVTFPVGSLCHGYTISLQQMLALKYLWAAIMFQLKHANFRLRNSLLVCKTA